MSDLSAMYEWSGQCSVWAVVEKGTNGTGFFSKIDKCTECYFEVTTLKIN